MEESVRDAYALSGATLAYVGDAVYELYVRTWMLSHGSVRTERLHKHVTALVNAGAQSMLYGLIEDKLSEEEQAVYRRGRNAKTLTAAKHQSISDYRRATGFEALMGFLSLTGNDARIAELLEESLPKLCVLAEERAAAVLQAKRAAELAAVSERSESPQSPEASEISETTSETTP